MKVHLVDGTFELFRCFHGAPRHKVDGREVGAVRGLLHTLLSLLKADDVTHVAVAFDALPSPRGPAQTDGDMIRAQAPLAFDAVRALGIALWPMVRYQADDALATGAARFRDHPAVSQVVLCTTDTDLFQCIVGDTVVVLDRIRKSVLDEAGFNERYGISPGQMPDFMALAGAPTKGIPGVKGWGRASTARALTHYGALEHIPTDTSWDIPIRNEAKLRAALAGQSREAAIVKALATLCDDLPIGDNLDEIQWNGVQHASLAEIIGAVEAADLQPRLERWPAYRSGMNAIH